MNHNEDRKKCIVLGVTGGIAVYKAADLCSKLAQRNYEVVTVMTQNACKLISERIFFTLSRNPVITDLFSVQDWKPEHIALAERALGQFHTAHRLNGLTALGALVSTTAGICWSEAHMLSSFHFNQKRGSTTLGRLMYVMRVIYSCANDPQGACSGSFAHTQTGRATLE